MNQPVNDPKNSPHVPKRTPTNGVRSAIRAVTVCPVYAHADWRLDDLGLATLLRAAVDAQSVRALFTPALGEDGSLGYLDGGLIAGIRQVAVPNMVLYTPFLMLVANIRDLEHSNFSGRTDALGLQPFPAAVSHDKTAVLILSAVGDRAIDHFVSRQRWAIERVTASKPGRSIANVTTDGQVRPIDGSLARVQDSAERPLASGILVNDGHGRVGLKLDALIRFANAIGLSWDLAEFPALPETEQLHVIDTFAANLRAAREALADAANGFAEFEVADRGRSRRVAVPGSLVREALNSFTTNATVVIAGYREAAHASFAASITRRYETIHTDVLMLPSGAGVARLAEQALDELADAGVFDDGDPRYGRRVAEFIKMPASRPSELQLEYLAMLTVWAFSRRTARALRVYASLALDGGPTTIEGRRKADVVAHLVRRCLPHAAETYHPAAAQSLLVGADKLPTPLWWRPIAEAMESIGTTATPATQAALAEARVRTVIAAAAAGALQAAYGAQETTRPRGQVSAFVNRMVTDETHPLAAWGRRQAEAIVEAYWDAAARDREPQVPQVSQDTPPRGMRYVPVREGGVVIPADDKWIRTKWQGRRRPVKDLNLTNDQHERAITDALTSASNALASYAKHLGSEGTVSGDWLAATGSTVIGLAGVLHGFRTGGEGGALPLI